MHTPWRCIVSASAFAEIATQTLDDLRTGHAVANTAVPEASAALRPDARLPALLRR